MLHYSRITIPPLGQLALPMPPLHPHLELLPLGEFSSKARKILQSSEKRRSWHSATGFESFLAFQQTCFLPVTELRTYAAPGRWFLRSLKLGEGRLTHSFFHCMCETFWENSEAEEPRDFDDALDCYLISSKSRENLLPLAFCSWPL